MNEKIKHFLKQDGLAFVCILILFGLLINAALTAQEYKNECDELYQPVVQAYYDSQGINNEYESNITFNYYPEAIE